MKELEKLAQSVRKASAFAEEIKTRVNNDLEKLQELKKTISENHNLLTDLDAQVKEASETLEKLATLLS